MATIVLTPNGKTPGQQQFGLDTFTEHYKCQNDDGSQISADDVLTDAGVPAMGSAHPDYSGMFVTGRNCDETGPKSPALDLVYMGSLAGTETLPAQKHDTESAVQSATSQMNSTGQASEQPVTLQYYAPSTTLEYISFGGPGSDVPSDPSDDPEVITFTVGSASLALGTTIAAIITNFFTTLIVASSQSSEVVAGQYWQNTSKKLKTLSPWALNLPPGAIIQLAAPGTGYALGNTLTITGGSGVATITITQLGISNSIANYDVTSNSCTTADSFVAGTGGAGSDAFFNIIIIT